MRHASDASCDALDVQSAGAVWLGVQSRVVAFAVINESVVWFRSVV